MAYTEPTQRSTGTAITATIYNTDIIDNISYLDDSVEPDLTNKSGGSVVAGDVVIQSTGTASSFTTTTTANATNVIGVVMESIANDASGRVARHGVVTVNVTGSVAIGDYLTTSTTVKLAKSVGSSLTIGSFAIALTADSGGTCTALLRFPAHSGSGADPSGTYGPNLVMNYPSLEGADGAQPEWWEVQSGNITLTEEDATGETIPQKHERVHKVVNGVSGGGEYAYQRFTYADQSWLDGAVTAVSAGVWVYTTGGTVTLTLFDGTDGSLGTASSTTTSAWEFIKIENITLGSGSYVDIRISNDTNSQTWYYAMPTLHIGNQARPFTVRGLRYISKYVVNVLSENPADTNWADLDFTSNTSNTTAMLNITAYIDGAAAYQGYARPNGSSAAQDDSTGLVTRSGAATFVGPMAILCDDGQIIEESVSSSSATAWRISLAGYWEWE